MKLQILLALAVVFGLLFAGGVQLGQSQTISIPDGNADYNIINTVDNVHWFHVYTQNCADLAAQVAGMKNTSIYPVIQFVNWTFTDANGNSADLDNWTVGLTPSTCVPGDNMLLQDLGAQPIADTNYFTTLVSLQNVSGITDKTINAGLSS